MNEIERRRALQRAQRLYPKSKAFRNVYMAGVNAALRGTPAEKCPYPRAAGTWRKSYRLAWLRGHGSVATAADEG